MTFEDRVRRVSVELLHDSPHVCPVPLDLSDQLSTILRFVKDTKWEVNRIERFVTGRIKESSEKSKEQGDSGETGTDFSPNGDDPVTDEGRAWKTVHDTLSTAAELALRDLPGAEPLIDWARREGGKFADFSPLWQRLLIYWDTLNIRKKVEDIHRGMFGPLSKLDALTSNVAGTTKDTNKKVSQLQEQFDDASEKFQDEIIGLAEMVTQLNEESDNQTTLLQDIIRTLQESVEPNFEDVRQAVDAIDASLRQCCTTMSSWLDTIYNKIVECCPIDLLSDLQTRTSSIEDTLADLKASVGMLLNGGQAVQSLNNESLSKAILSQVIEIRRLLQQ